MPMWNMSGQCPPLPGKCACFLIIFLKEEVKGLQAFATQNAPVASASRRKAVMEWLLTPECGARSLPGWAVRRGDTDLISLAGSCLALAVTDGSSSSEARRAERLFPNWVGSPLMPPLQGKAGKGL